MKWQIRSHSEKPLPKNSIQDIISALLANRQIRGKKQIQAFLNPELTKLDQQFFVKEQISRAVNRIKKAIKNKQQIIVYSDYDVDGITGGAILWETLHALGARVMPYVPDRFTEGYGLSVKGIDAIFSMYPDISLIITVDQGITKVKETAYAGKKGIDVIITDHHTKPKKLPIAYAILHTPKLSGSGVSYVVSRMLISGLDQKIERKLVDHLALASLGTVADLVPLIGPNRVIVHYGLQELTKTKRIGLSALIQVAGLTGKKLGTYEIGYILGPRINAAGRLENGMLALQLLCTKNSARAHDLSVKLDLLNTTRQREVESALIHARKQVIGTDMLLFAGDSSYNEGVIGLVAGHLTEEFYRPSIIMSYKETYTKGSARSVHGINIISLLQKQSDLLIDVGGHPLAAGFTVKNDKIALLKKNLISAIEQEVTEDIFEKEGFVDMELPLELVTRSLVDELKVLEPHGVGNPQPVFIARSVKIANVRLIGREQSHLLFSVYPSTSHNKAFSIDAIAFSQGGRFDELRADSTYDVVYKVGLNEWNGSSKIQLVVKDFWGA